MKIFLVLFFSLFIVSLTQVYRVKNEINNDDGITADLELESGR
jgi:hypothetical protein